jgi:hypothetical protein
LAGPSEFDHETIAPASVAAFGIAIVADLGSLSDSVATAHATAATRGAVIMGIRRCTRSIAATTVGSVVVVTGLPGLDDAVTTE